LSIEPFSEGCGWLDAQTAGLPAPQSIGTGQPPLSATAADAATGTS
jgi:hypothetical protein